MSIKHMSKVWQIDNLEPSQKLVFLSICDNANDEGICYPSINTIQSKTSLSRPTVIKIINKLVELNYLIKTQRARKSGGRYSSLYLVFPDENLAFLDEEYREKFVQSKKALPYSQSKVALPEKGSQSKVALPEPSLTLFNHHLFIKLNSTSKELYLEYVELRKKMKLVTSLKVHDRLLSKFFEFGEDNTVIENAINSNWRDFYKPKQQPTTNIIDEWGNYDDYLTLWNEFASKNNLRTHPILTSVNKNNIKARLEDYKNFFEIFKYSLVKAKESSFLMSGDYFDFEWLIANDDNIIKVYKGKYDDKKGIEVII